MSDHFLFWLAGLSVGVASAIAVTIATRFELLPEVVDPSFVLTGSGLGGLTGAAYGAVRRYSADRLGRLVLLGNLIGAAIFGALFLLGLAGVSL